MTALAFQDRPTSIGWRPTMDVCSPNGSSANTSPAHTCSHRGRARTLPHATFPQAASDDGLTRARVKVSCP
jgi:hypothetical protein